MYVCMYACVSIVEAIDDGRLSEWTHVFSTMHQDQDVPFDEHNKVPNVCVCVCVYVCVYVCTYVCVCVCLHSLLLEKSCYHQPICMCVCVHKCV